jgi:hypothetical protein
MTTIYNPYESGYQWTMSDYTPVTPEDHQIMLKYLKNKHKKQ